MKTWRDVRKACKEAGGTSSQGKGSRERWKLPNGQSVYVDTRHLGDQVRTSVLKLIEKNLSKDPT